MLVQLLPEEVNKRWDFFAKAIGEALPPTVSKTIQGMTRVLRSILLERLDVWVYLNEREEVILIMTTLIREDEVTGQKNLLIYTFTAVRPMTSRIWQEIYEVLINQARGRGAKGIIAYTQNEEIAEYINKADYGKATYRLLELEV